MVFSHVFFKGLRLFCGSIPSFEVEIMMLGDHAKQAIFMWSSNPRTGQRLRSMNSVFTRWKGAALAAFLEGYYVKPTVKQTRQM